MGYHGSAHKNSPGVQLQEHERTLVSKKAHGKLAIRKLKSHYTETFIQFAHLCIQKAINDGLCFLVPDDERFTLILRLRSIGVS